jgi:GNAT superfamily N-acetyltransferase
MRQLPDLPNLNQLRHQARELQGANQQPMTLSQAQLALARLYGFPCWAKLKAEVHRRRAHPTRDRDRSITIRAIESVEELVQSELVIPRHVIALEPDVRRKGIGRRLMERIELEATRFGAREMYLGGANAENRAFYWRLGFQGRKSLMQKALPRRAPSRIESGGMADESEHRSDV